MLRSDVEPDTILFGYRTGVLPENAVSLTMPVRMDQYDAMAGLLPLFEMHLPEGVLKERLRLAFAKTIPDFDDLDLLQIVGTSLIGRLRYSLSDTIEESVPAQDLSEILTYKGSADLFAHLLERFSTYSGISGVQPKVLVRATEQFALMVAYSCVVGNGDAHRKNFSVLYANPEAEVTFAPAYDIVSTLV